MKPQQPAGGGNIQTVDKIKRKDIRGKLLNEKVRKEEENITKRRNKTQKNWTKYI
jgi:hypothetical protein